MSLLGEEKNFLQVGRRLHSRVGRLTVLVLLYVEPATVTFGLECL